MLQDYTTWFVIVTLNLLSIPVFVDGVYLSIPAGDFHVAEACAGLRFLVATVALGTLMANVAYKTTGAAGSRRGSVLCGPGYCEWVQGQWHHTYRPLVGYEICNRRRSYHIWVGVFCTSTTDIYFYIHDIYQSGLE